LWPPQNLMTSRNILFGIAPEEGAVLHVPAKGAEEGIRHAAELKTGTAGE